jgi:four helix bundle protein
MATEKQIRNRILEDRLIDFSLMVRELLNCLPNDAFSANLKYQLSKSSVSPAFNYGEAQGAESKKDFIHKMGICLKELKETYIGLKVIERGPFQLDHVNIGKVIQENNQLISIFVKSIRTAKSRA